MIIKKAAPRAAVHRNRSAGVYGIRRFE